MPGIRRDLYPLCNSPGSILFQMKGCLSCLGFAANGVERQLVDMAGSSVSVLVHSGTVTITS